MRSPFALAGPHPKQILFGAYVSCRLSSLMGTNLKCISSGEFQQAVHFRIGQKAPLTGRNVERNISELNSFQINDLQRGSALNILQCSEHSPNMPVLSFV